MEKKLNKFQLFFDISGGSPAGRRQLKRRVSMKEFNVANESPLRFPALESYMESRLNPKLSVMSE